MKKQLTILAIISRLKNKIKNQMNLSRVKIYSVLCEAYLTGTCLQCLLPFTIFFYIFMGVCPLIDIFMGPIIYPGYGPTDLINGLQFNFV